MNESGLAASERQSVLCVDLDGTLLRSDMLVESFCAFIKSRPYALPMVLLWILQGKARCKAELAKRVTMAVDSLPYHQEFLAFLKAERANGRKLVLATATDASLAGEVANHVGVFDEVVASDGVHNLKGARKAQLLKERYGTFDYAGNDYADIPVWKAADKAIVVAPVAGVRAALERVRPVDREFPEERTASLRTYLRAIRVHQWVKNILLFVAAIAAHRVTDVAVVVQLLIAFGAFCCAASSVYLLNDLLDLDADRRHHQKKKRPFAAGDIPLSHGLFLTPLFFGAALIAAAAVSWPFVGILCCYALLTLTYSLWLKRVVLLDVIILAGLYTIRLFAGGVAAAIPVSEWLLAFAMFFFFSLACVKRYSELFNLREAKESHSRGRGYVASDLEQVGTFGTVSGYLSVLVLALYMKSSEVTTLYDHPRALWLLCPALLYWISRVWLLAQRGELDEDPIVFALRDRVSFLVGAIVAAVLAFASV